MYLSFSEQVASENFSTIVESDKIIEKLHSMDATDATASESSKNKIIFSKSNLVVNCDSQNSSMSDFLKKEAYVKEKPPYSLSPFFSTFPQHVQQLLIKGRVSCKPSYLSPYRCVLTRHPVHRISTELDILGLVENIRLNGYIEAYSKNAPLIAVKYSKPQNFFTRTADNCTATVYDNWSNHPLLYAIAGAGRGEAIAKFFQNCETVRFVKNDSNIADNSFNNSRTENSTESDNVSNHKTKKPLLSMSEKTALNGETLSTLGDSVDDVNSGKTKTIVNQGEPTITVEQVKEETSTISDESQGLGFYILTEGENLSGWELFLLSTALNASDPNSRRFNYFERTDQIAFICLELSRRKHADVSCREIAVEICTNPFLQELKNHLRLDSQKVLMFQSILDPENSREVTEQLMQSRALFTYLPPNMGVLLQNIPQQQLDILDVMIDMATCVNSQKMKYTGTFRQNQGSIPSNSKQTQSCEPTPNTKAEGFLHSVAEDQLRFFFAHIVPVESASNFDVLVIRDLVSAVFGAMQECSREFREAVAVKRKSETESLATCPAAGAYWIERIVYETSPGGLLAGLWNFPAAALVILFYIYFVNHIQTFDKENIRTRLLSVGTILYRCIAELALTLRVSKISLVGASTAIHLRILEGAAILFRLALFGVVHVKCFPAHPYKIPATELNFSALHLATKSGDRLVVGPTVKQPSNDAKEFPVYTFTDFNTCYQFLYSHWFKNLIHSRLTPSKDYIRPCEPEVANVSTNDHEECKSPSISVALPQENSAPPCPTITNHVGKGRPWYEARRIEVAATANRLRQEIETIVSKKDSIKRGGKSKERIHVRRVTEKVDPNHITLSCSERPSTSIEVEILDPSVLPMASSAKLEFLSLVQGVVAMLIERHRCWDSDTIASADSESKAQILSVPANMIVLAAIKVALTFISPHFDRLAPHLVHWISVRCRLILWIWRECRAEVTQSAEQHWNKLWVKHFPHNPIPQKLKLRFTSVQFADGNFVDLTPAKLGRVVLGVLPSILQSMIAFYEQRENQPDDVVTREFFAKWLKCRDDNDLVSHVNMLLTQPTSKEKCEHVQDSNDYFACLPETNDNSNNYPPTDNNLSVYNNSYTQPKTTRDEEIPSESSYYNYTSFPLSGSFGGIVASSPLSLPPSSVPNPAGYQEAPSTSKSCTPCVSQPPSLLTREPSLGKKSKKLLNMNTRRNPLNEDLYFLEWLETLTCTERLRLESLEVPQWELPKLCHVPPSDLLLWRCPDNINPLSGNGLKSGPFDRREWQQFYQPEHSTDGLSHSYNLPLSDLDWKVTVGVLILLRSRGVDTLVSRNRGRVFFLDNNQSDPRVFDQHVNTSLDKLFDSEKERLLENEEGKKKDLSLNGGSSKRRKTHNSGVGVHKRYGAAFSKSNDLFSIPSHELLNDHICDLDEIRYFLENEELSG